MVVPVISGCGLLNPHSPTNTTGKEVVYAFDVALDVLDKSCQAFATDIHDDKMLAACTDGYTRAKAKIVDVEVALNDPNRSFVCAVALANSTMKDFADVYTSKGNQLPEVVRTALAIGDAIGASCVPTLTHNIPNL